MSNNNKNRSQAERPQRDELRYLLKTCRSLRQKLAGARRAVDLSRARIDAYLREQPPYLRHEPVPAKAIRIKPQNRYA